MKSCADRPETESFRTLGEIVADFIHKWRAVAKKELEFYGKQASLAAAIEKAGMAEMANGSGTLGTLVQSVRRD